MRKTNVDDVVYLGEVKYIIKNKYITKESLEENPKYNNNPTYGILLQQEANDDTLWIPYTMEGLLSYTPYTIRDNELEGFSFEKPWQPVENQVVWVRNSIFENWTLKVFKEMEGNKYRSSSMLLDDGDELLNCDSFIHCKPFDANELRFEKDSNPPIPPVINEGDLVIVWDNVIPDNRKIRVFYSMDSSGNSVYVSRVMDKNSNKFHRKEHWNNCIPYTSLNGVLPVMVEYEDRKSIKLKVENEYVAKQFSKIQGISKEDYFYTRKGHVSYEPYEKSKFTFNLTE